MRVFEILVLTFVTLRGPVQAKQNAITCTTTADCTWGETCVAGDAEKSVQSCVPPTVCGGQSMGNCPSDDAGELACLWRPFDDCRDGCAILNGKKGIYKCVSIARCDAYYGEASCSNGCIVNGASCNGQGSCNMMETMADGTPMLGCTCDNGYRGERCEFAPGLMPSTNSSSPDSSGSGGDDTSDNTTDQSPTKRSHEKPSGCTSADCKTLSSTLPSGVRTGKLVTIITLSALALIGVILLVVRSRRIKQETNKEFADALAFTQGEEPVVMRDLNSSLSSTSL